MTMLFPCSALNVKVVGKFKQTRVNGARIYDSLKVTSPECQSNGNLKQTRVNGGWYQPCLSLKVASALNVKVIEIPTSVDASELWLRDDLEEVYALLFRFLGFGFRLAMSNVGWHVTQQFVILVPDPIAFAPRPALLDEGEPCDICQYTSFRPRVCSCVTLPSQVHRRQKQVSDSVSTKSKKSTAKRGSLCDPRKSHKTVTYHGLRVMEPVCHQASLRGRFRSWMRASRQGQPCSCLFFKTHQIGLLMCFCVQSRRRPEKWTRTRKASSRRSVMVDFVCVCTLFGLHLFSQDDGGGWCRRCRRSRRSSSCRGKRCHL